MKIYSAVSFVNVQKACRELATDEHKVRYTVHNIIELMRKKPATGRVRR